MCLGNSQLEVASPGLVGLNLGLSGPEDLKPAGRLKSTRGRRRSSKSDGRMLSDTATFAESILAPLRKWILSAADIPVSRFPLPGNGGGHPITDIFGPKCSESFAAYDPASSSWKMSQGTFPWDSGEFSETWPRAGSMRSGTVFRHLPSAPLTEEIGCSLLPTPAAQEPGWKNIEVVDKNGNPPEHPNQRFYDKTSGRLVQKGLSQVIRMWPTPRVFDSQQRGNARGFPGSLASEVNLRQWRTPLASDGTKQGHGNLAHQVKRWPTPKASASGPDYARRSREGSGGDDLATVVGGQLNPTWVEWLMGFPPGWTDLPVSVTPLSRKSRKRSGKGS